MRSEFDERDAEILRHRQSAYDEISGPRVGDWVLLPDGAMRRFTHRWPEGLQVATCAGDCGSFYLGDGYVSYSGSLDPSIPLERLRDTGSTYPARVWFFHHDWAKAHNGVDCEIPFRVFEFV